MKLSVVRWKVKVSFRITRQISVRNIKVRIDYDIFNQQKEV